MRLSTSTGILAVNRGGPHTDTLECIRRCAEVGYNVLDIDLRFVRHQAFFLIQDDWERQFETIGDEAAKRGIEFSQSHIPCYHPVNESDPYYSDPELHAWFEKMCERAYYASSALGVQWAVVHAFTAVDKNCELKESKRKNIDYFGPYLELAKRLGIGIAFENRSDGDGSPIHRRYTATYEELVDLVQAFNDDSVGICWDFGHANIMKYDQCKALQYIGRLLKATHVHDNLGVTDTHHLPFMGTVQWEDIMKTLADIGYEGDFTFEVHGMTDHLPAPLKQSALKYSYEVGQYLLSLQYA